MAALSSARLHFLSRRRPHKSPHSINATLRDTRLGNKDDAERLVDLNPMRIASLSRQGVMFLWHVRDALAAYQVKQKEQADN